MPAQKNLTGPSPEWIENYKRKTTPKSGFMSIAPAPLFAWCCEQVLGGHDASTVIGANRENGPAWRRVRELHAQLLLARQQH